MDGKIYWQQKHKELSNTVDKLENERVNNRSFEHKVKLTEAKKLKLKAKEFSYDPDIHGGGVESFG